MSNSYFYFKFLDFSLEVLKYRSVHAFRDPEVLWEAFFCEIQWLLKSIWICVKISIISTPTSKITTLQAFFNNSGRQKFSHLRDKKNLGWRQKPWIFNLVFYTLGWDIFLVSPVPYLNVFIFRALINFTKTIFRLTVPYQLSQGSRQSYFIRAHLWNNFGVTLGLAGAINRKMVLVNLV